MLTLEQVETVIREDAQALRMVIVCALNDPRIFKTLVDLVQQDHAAQTPAECVATRLIGERLAFMINKHVRDHASDSFQMAQTVALLTTPAANQTPQ